VGGSTTLLKKEAMKSIKPQLINGFSFTDSVRITRLFVFGVGPWGLRGVVERMVDQQSKSALICAYLYTSLYV
jgi:hypothetical protein